MKNWKMYSALVAFVLFPFLSNAACWVTTSPFRMMTNPPPGMVVARYEWTVKSRTAVNLYPTTEPILELIWPGLSDSPLTFTVVAFDTNNQPGPVSPRSDFIFAYPPNGTDLNGDGKVTFQEDYLGRPTLTGFSATIGCKSCAIVNGVGQCPADPQ